MDLVDRKLLNLIQAPFPMMERPYLELGEQVGIDEEEVLARLAELKRQNVLRQISAIFDTRRLGYQTTLVAMALDPGELHQAAQEINKHPGVSHNYAREGSYYNLWFTLAVPPEHDLEATANYMGRKTSCLGHPHNADHPVLQDRGELRHGQQKGVIVQLQPRWFRQGGIG